MAELTTRERRQPCLLDRLTDDEPDIRQESRDRRVMSAAQIRRGVLRDLAWLLNTAARSSTEQFDEFPQVESSVLNYGIEDLCGKTGSGLDEGSIQRMVAEAVRRYEPRIMPGSLSVHVAADKDSMGAHSLTFEITGQLWAQPMPEQLYVKTELDLETGQFAVEDRPNG